MKKNSNYMLKSYVSIGNGVPEIDEMQSLVAFHCHCHGIVGSVSASRGAVVAISHVVAAVIT